MISLPRNFSFWLFLALVMLGLYNAYGNAFMQDDAYISYNYAKWFSRGHGLVWYPGSTEFGYTNFLYTLMIGVAMLFGIPPEWASNTINMASFVGSLVFTYKISTRLLTTSFLLLIPVLLLATHHTFTAYATGGLETMWVTMLILAFYDQVLREQKNYEVIGTLAAIALLSRLDTAILLFFGYVYLVLCHCEPRRSDSEGGRGNPWRKRLKRCLDCFVLLRNPRNDVWAAIIIPLITILGFLLVCTIAYGYALPNAFYIKMPGDDGMMKYGLRYLWLYTMLHAYLPLFVPLFIIYFFAKRDFLVRLGSPTLLLALTLLLWLCYIVYVGGDFMEFRFLVPLLGFYYIVIMRLIQVLIPTRKTLVAIGVTCLFLFGNFLHPTLFTTKPNALDFPMVPKPFEYAFVESTDMLHDWLSHPKAGWIEVGKGLRTLFPNTQDINIAATAAGAISFYSDQHIIDALGLNTRAVQYDFDPFMPRAGHRVKATDTLLRRLAHLNISHPQLLCEQKDRFAWVDNISREFLFAHHETLLLPLGNACYVVADYLSPHPAIDALLTNRAILRYRDVATRTNCPAWLCLR